MATQVKPRKCLCCREFFAPDYRNRHHQVFCSKSTCRAASKRASQQRWLRQPANRNYFRSPENVQRVQAWRRVHPNRSKSQSTQPNPSQAIPPEQLAKGSPLVTPRRHPAALQDLCLADHPDFMGLISFITGASLQEDIAATARKIHARGRDILGLHPPNPSPNAYDCQTPALP